MGDVFRTSFDISRDAESVGVEDVPKAVGADNNVSKIANVNIIFILETCLRRFGLLLA
ncbi:MAG: hypothetical protein PHQ39_13140 [Methanothrix soehngenii]|jgi:hypothetical protein|nr:hypothetical protein [Methanothrix soehngenii]